MSALSERVERLEARFELSDLAARYFHLVDGRDIPGVAALFTDDGAFHFPGGAVAGRPELEAFYATQLARWPATYHYPHSHVVRVVDDGAASGVVDAHAEHAVDDTCVLAALRYEDDYARVEGRWRFVRRELHIRYFLPWEKLGSAYRHSPRFPGPPL